MHVIEFFSNLKDTTVHDHKVFVVLRSVAASSLRGLINWNIDLVPLVGGHVELPGVIYLLIVIVLSSKNEHMISIVIHSDNG